MEDLEDPIVAPIGLLEPSSTLKQSAADNKVEEITPSSEPTKEKSEADDTSSIAHSLSEATDSVSTQCAANIGTPAITNLEESAEDSNAEKIVETIVRKEGNLSLRERMWNLKTRDMSRRPTYDYDAPIRSDNDLLRVAEFPHRYYFNGKYQIRRLPRFPNPYEELLVFKNHLPLKPPMHKGLHIDSLEASRKIRMSNSSGGGSDQIDKIRQGVQPPRHHWKKIDAESAEAAIIPSEYWTLIGKLKMEAVLSEKYAAGIRGFKPPSPSRQDSAQDSAQATLCRRS
ncbi:universal stress protein [Sesbania bispinosa]|nr:universal stress protein [Sesbania bispinosa]